MLPVLKGKSLIQPIPDTGACEEAMHAGASCMPCPVKFKLCRGHFTYEPFTVVLFEAFCTVAIGICMNLCQTLRGKGSMSSLVDWRALLRVAPIGATYALGDVMDIFAASRCSASTLLVASQLRLPVCALLRWLLLGRGQSLKQWLVLFGITWFCLVQVASDLGGANIAGESSMG